MSIVCDKCNCSTKTCPSAARWSGKKLLERTQKEGSCVFFLLFLSSAVGFTTNQHPWGIPAVFLNNRTASIFEAYPFRLSFLLWHMPLLIECWWIFSFPSLIEREKKEGGKKQIEQYIERVTLYDKVGFISEMQGMIQYLQLKQCDKTH